MDYVSADLRNPFGLSPPCESFVPGYGDTRAHFHVVGDHPGIHGGETTGIPFTDRPWTDRFFGALDRGGLIDGADLAEGEVDPGKTFFSYLHMCDPGPDGDLDYAGLEPFFDSELRAITAHVLLPVGTRALAHVLDNYTSRASGTLDADAWHAEEIQGSGWLVVPIKDPAEWSGDDADRVVDRLIDLQNTDYRQVSDLGRFLPGEDRYMVR